MDVLNSGKNDALVFEEVEKKDEEREKVQKSLQKEIEDRAGNLLDERDRMIQQRLWLQNELDNVGAG